MQTAYSYSDITRTNIVLELLVRIALLSMFVVMNAMVSPHGRLATAPVVLLPRHQRPRRASIVPSWLMLCVVLCVPVALLLAPRLLTPSPAADALTAALAWTLALVINADITEFLKLVVARPRPDYFYRCFPDGKVTKGFHYTGDPREVMEGRKSFPSGHSSFSFCSLGFLSMWLCGRLGVLSRHRGEWARAACCAAPLLLALAIGLSRCLDHHHHWEDVTAGALLGLAVAYSCYRRYYHPLESELSGLPYGTFVTFLSPTNSETELSIDSFIEDNDDDKNHDDDDTIKTNLSSIA